MLSLATTNRCLIEAKPYFTSINPGVANLFSIQIHQKLVKAAFTVGKGYMAYRYWRKTGDTVQTLGDFLGFYVTKKMKSPIKSRIGRMHVTASRTGHDMFRKNGMGGRSWYDRPRREKLVIVYHDANRAGPHIDVHIGRVSLVYRVKPDLYSKINYNRNGDLTEASKRAILEHVRTEVQGHSRVAQNLDHSRSNAVASWVNGDTTATHYGAGLTRQVVLESEVDIYKAHWNGPIEMYSPDINPHRATYLYRLHPGDSKRAPILIWGVKSNQPPVLQDRLHLKMIHPEHQDQLHMKADMSTSTAKYDGSSCYVVITNKGTTVWSPRTSVVTGERIEYTHKLDGIASITNDETIVAMGELLFKVDGEYLPAAQGSGILNSNSLLPRGVEPEIRLYRVDRVGRKSFFGTSFWENREQQMRVSKLDRKLKVVELMDPDTAHARGFEGIVAVPEDGSVNDGFKMKYWADPYDWVIERVEFTRGPSGKVAGVVRARSLESDKEFKLGPGQMGNEELTTHMMENPHLYEGSVIKVNSKLGHEGRAAKVISFHDDKGLATV